MHRSGGGYRAPTCRTNPPRPPRGPRAAPRDEVRLPGPVDDGDYPQADEVVLGGRGGVELDGPAGTTEVHDPERVIPAPVQDELHRLGQFDVLDQGLLITPLRSHHAKLKFGGFGHPAGIPGRLHYHLDVDTLDSRHA